MSKESKPQYASVEQPFGCDPPNVHCPICGKASLQPPGDDEVAQLDPCRHLVFIFVDEVGEFEYMSEDFKKRTKDRDLTKISVRNFKRLLKESGYDNSLLAIEITFGGMAGGPVLYSVIYGFDYGTIEK